MVADASHGADIAVTAAGIKDPEYRNNGMSVVQLA
jgi:hypothetical protein